MKLKIFVPTAVMMFALLGYNCQAQSNICGAANFAFYGNFQNQQVRLNVIGINGDLYNTLADNLAGNYADPQAAYLYDAIMNSNDPVVSVVAQITVNSNGIAQDGPSTFIAPSSPQFQNALQEILVWSYMQYWYSNLNQQSEINLEQNNFQRVFESEWQQQFGINLATEVNVATIIGPITEDLSSMLGDSDAANQIGDFVSLYQDSGSLSSLQSNFGSTASDILNVLQKYHVVNGQNYTSAQFVVGMANLNTGQLAQFESDLFSAAYPGQTLKPDAQQYLTTFLENAGASAEQLGISAAASGAEAFYEAYALAQFPASASAEVAASQAGSYFVDGLPALAAWSAASTVMQVYVTPQADILQDMVYCQDTITTSLFPELNSTSGEMMGNNGFPNFDDGIVVAADIEAISSYEALWCNLGAEEETNQIVQTQLQQYITFGPAFNGRAANMYNILVTANSIASNLVNQSISIPVPSVNGLSQPNGVLGDEFTISGTNFCNAVAVYFSNSPTWFQVNSSTSITTVVPAGTNTVDVRVVGPGGVSQITANDQFTYGTASVTPTNKVISLNGNLSFGSVTIETSAQRTLTISNTGNTNLTVSGISYPNGFSGSWSGIIQAGGSTNITVTFLPTSATNYGGNVTINSDANSGNNVISISGTGENASSGTAPIIVLTPWTDTDFGDVPVNSSGTRVVTIYNAGNANLVITGISYPPGFSGNYNNGTITPQNEVALSITFSPTAIIPYGGMMTVTSDIPSGITNLSLSGMGVSPPPPSTNEVPVCGFESLHSFNDYDGNNPIGTLALGNDGAFYGTTYRGGSKPNGNLNAWGTVFRITPSGGNNFFSLYSFPDYSSSASGPGANGGNPWSGLILGNDGNFYGTTQVDPNYGAGTVFCITPAGILTTLLTFNDVDGEIPWGLVEGRDGNFYGTTESASASSGEFGNVFCITPSGEITNLYYFTSNVGEAPFAGLVLGTDGNFYGTTTLGGATDNGTIFKVAPNGTFINLVSFTNDPSYSSMVEGKDGNFYGTTLSTVFRVTTNGSLTTLYSFTGGSDGTFAYGGLVMANDGNFYGTTGRGGISNNGTIFRITPNGSFTTLHWFQGNDGSKPMSTMVQGPDGNLYGTTENGGTNGGFGTVFRLVIPPFVQPLVPVGNNLNVTWSCIPEQTYQVQYASDLTSGNWTNLTSQLTPSFSTTTVSDTISPTNQQRFYRIVEYPVAW